MNLTGVDVMGDIEYINYSELVDKIDWDNDLYVWTLRKEDLDGLVRTKKDACARCKNNPLNGGSGACNCVLGMSPATC